jgi:hypothetical protein
MIVNPLAFSARRWLASFEAAGGRFHIVGAGALTQAATPRAERLAHRILRNRSQWVAVYQLAAALGSSPRGTHL